MRLDFAFFPDWKLSNQSTTILSMNLAIILACVGGGARQDISGENLNTTVCFAFSCTAAFDEQRDSHPQ